MREVRIGLMLAACAAILLSVAEAQSLPERCRLEPVRGNCKAILEKVYFDRGRQKCVSFNYDGCGPNVPFDEMKDCLATCETDATVRLADFRRVDGRPFIRVDIEYPKDWTEDPAFVARISGHEVVSRRIGGGSSPDATLATLEVFLGTEPVTDLSIETTVGGKPYRVFMPLFWTPEPLLLLLDHIGRDEALLAPLPAELRIVTFKTGTPTVRHNGAELAAEAVIGSATHATLWRFKPRWTAERNTLSLAANTADGTQLKRDYSFVNLADGSLAYRQKILVAYGEPGSRSGPFYRLDSANDRLALGAERIIDVDSLDAWGWPGRTPLLVREMVGAAPGEAVLRIYEKAHFLGGEQVRQEIHLRVTK